MGGVPSERSGCRRRGGRDESEPCQIPHGRAAGLGAWRRPVRGVGVAVAAVPDARAANFTVTKTADTADGICDADCSLREAIIAANAGPGADIITLPAGTYTLTIAGANEDDAATGDLDIKGDLMINGATGATTIIDGGAIDRVFQVIGAVTVTLNA